MRQTSQGAWISERVRNRALTDKVVGGIFGSLCPRLVGKAVGDADIALGEVNAMADLTVHPQLRRIEVDTPTDITYPAPGDLRRGPKTLRHRAGHRSTCRSQDTEII